MDQFPRCRIESGFGSHIGLADLYRIWRNVIHDKSITSKQKIISAHYGMWEWGPDFRCPEWSHS